MSEVLYSPPGLTKDQGKTMKKLWHSVILRVSKLRHEAHVANAVVKNIPRMFCFPSYVSGKPFKKFSAFLTVSPFCGVILTIALVPSFFVISSTIISCIAPTTFSCLRLAISEVIRGKKSKMERKSGNFFICLHPHVSYVNKCYTPTCDVMCVCVCVTRSNYVLWPSGYITSNTST